MGLAALALITAGWNLREVWLQLLDPDELSRLGSRLSWLSLSVSAMLSYQILIRGSDRDVLDPHPVHPPALLPYLRARSLAWAGVLPAGLALAAWPLLQDGLLAWCLLVTLSGLGAGLGVLLGFPVYFLAVQAAESPSLSHVLEALRGQSPRLQAALIYAPGLVLLTGGLLLTVSTDGAVALMKGELSEGWRLLCPLLALLLLPSTARLSRRGYYRATLILGEIEARYAGLESEEEARRVYLEWTVRWLPAGWRLPALQELRLGWRGLRTWLTGTWLLGLVAASVAWSKDPAVALGSLTLSSAGIAANAAVALLLAKRSDGWLALWLGPPRLEAWRVRSWVVWAWMQPAILLPAGALLLRQGRSVALGWTAELELWTLGVSLLAGGCSLLRPKRRWLYGPLVLAAWAFWMRGVL